MQLFFFQPKVMIFFEFYAVLTYFEKELGLSSSTLVF